MRTVSCLLSKLGFSNLIIKKYNGRRDFKNIIINFNCHEADIFANAIFCTYPYAYSWRKMIISPTKYKPLLEHAKQIVTNYYPILVDPLLPEISGILRKKKNRIKYWLEIKMRLKELGVKF